MTPKKTKAQSLNQYIEEGDLGGYLKHARELAGLSQAEVAKKLKMSQFQSISQWERNASGSVPVNTLLKLAEIYQLPMDEIYEVLVSYQTKRMEEKLQKKFFGKSKNRSA